MREGWMVWCWTIGWMFIDIGIAIWSKLWCISCYMRSWRIIAHPKSLDTVHDRWRSWTDGCMPKLVEFQDWWIDGTLREDIIAPIGFPMDISNGLSTKPPLLTREYHVQNLSRSAGANWLEALLVTSMVTDFLAKQAQVIEFKVYTKHAGDINHRNLVYFIFVEQTATLEIDFLWSTARSWGWRELGPCFKVNFCEIVGIGHDHSTWKEVVRA